MQARIQDLLTGFLCGSLFLLSAAWASTAMYKSGPRKTVLPPSEASINRGSRPVSSGESRVLLDPETGDVWFVEVQKAGSR